MHTSWSFLVLLISMGVTDETTVREKTTDQSETKELSLCTNTIFNCANGNSVQVRFLTVCQRLGSGDEISTVSVSPLTDVSAALSRDRKFVALRALRCEIFCPQHSRPCFGCPKHRVLRSPTRTADEPLGSKVLFLYLFRTKLRRMLSERCR